MTPSPDSEEKQRLADAVDRLAGVRVLVVGDAMLDRYIKGVVERISPEAPVPIFLAREEFDRLGGAANVAANLVALGGVGDLVALVGRAPAHPAPDHPDSPPAEAPTLDPLGDPILGAWLAPAPPQLDARSPSPKTPREFAREADWAAARLALKCAGRGFDAHLLPLMDATIVKTRLMAGQQQILRIDHESAAAPHAVTLSPSSSPATTAVVDGRGRLARAEVLAPLLAAADVVIVSDYAKGMVDGELFDLLTASGKPLVVDPRPAHRALYRKATVVTPNRREAMDMVGMTGTPRLASTELARRTVDAVGTDVLLTLGEEGMVVATRDGKMTSLPAHAKEVFDVTGAGDTVAAVVGLGLGAGLSLVDAARLANAAAGVVVGRLGTATASPGEVRAMLRAE